MRLKTAIPAIGLTLLAIAFISVILNIAIRTPQKVEDTQSITSCVKEILSGDEQDTLAAKVSASDACYRIFYGENLLGDFKIRRIKFIQQQYDEVVMLWMVVAITLSGVALAAVQLAASYKLAARQGKDLDVTANEITVERDRLVFKSSVTGLAILIVSFAFFLVFILEVYTIRVIDVDRSSSASQFNAPQTQLQQPQNGYTAPSPTEPKK